MTSTYSYAMPAVNLVSGVADVLLNNRLGNWSLKFMESSVGTVRQYIDTFVPPIAVENVTAERIL